MEISEFYYYIYFYFFLLHIFLKTICAEVENITFLSALEQF